MWQIPHYSACQMKLSKYQVRVQMGWVLSGMPHSSRTSGFIHVSSSSSSWHHLQMQVCNADFWEHLPSALCGTDRADGECLRQLTNLPSYEIQCLSTNSVSLGLEEVTLKLEGKTRFTFFMAALTRDYLWLLLTFTPQLFWRFLFAKWQRIACLAYLKCLYICGLFTFSKSR